MLIGHVGGVMQMGGVNGIVDFNVFRRLNNPRLAGAGVRQGRPLKIVGRVALLPQELVGGSPGYHQPIRRYQGVNAGVHLRLRQPGRPQYRPPLGNRHAGIQMAGGYGPRRNARAGKLTGRPSRRLRSLINQGKVIGQAFGRRGRGDFPVQFRVERHAVMPDQAAGDTIQRVGQQASQLAQKPQRGRGRSLPLYHAEPQGNGGDQGRQSSESQDLFPAEHLIPPSAQSLHRPRPGRAAHYPRRDNSSS